MNNRIYRIAGSLFVLFLGMVWFGSPDFVLAEEAVAPGASDLVISTNETAEPGDSESVILTKSTMSRTTDFVVLHGKKLKNNLHKKNDLMALFAAIDGEIQVVPFQIDEINKDGMRVLPLRPSSEKKSKKVAEKDEDDGHLDENDELTFMIWDTGDRIDKKYLPKEVLAVDEIRIEDELSGGKSWVYLCSYCANPPRSEKDYAHYDIENERLITRSSLTGFSKTVPMSYEYMSIMGGPDYFDSYKMRYHIRIFGIDMNVDETQFDAKLHGYKDGPVRVIRMVRSQVYMNRWMKSPSGYSTTIYYANAVVMPYTMKIPVNMYRFKRFLKVKVRAGCDFSGLRGWKAKSEADPTWLAVDGKMDEIEKNVNKENVQWAILAGPEYGLLMRMVWDRKQDGTPQEALFDSDFYYVDDDLAFDPPEFVPGQSPAIGFWMRGMENIRKGTYFFYVLIHIIEKPWSETVEKEYLNIMDSPLLTIVNEN